MFAGIVAGTGRVVAVEKAPGPSAGRRRARSGTTGAAPGAALRLIVDVRVLRRKLVPGASVAVAGTCLTVVRAAAGRAVFDVVGETVRRTTLGALRTGDQVNLEGSLRVGDEIGGHQVAGHVDGVGDVLSVERRGDETWLTVRAPKAVHATLVEKGWVAIDGCSLTVAGLEPPARGGSGTFAVALIPTTLAITTLGRAARGTKVNLEGDPLGKQVAKWMAARARPIRTR